MEADKFLVKTLGVLGSLSECHPLALQFILNAILGGMATFQTSFSFRSTDETFSLAEETCSSNPAIVRRKKIAISIIFSLCEKEEAQRNFQDFFFSHFPLFESHMNRLKSAIEKVIRM